MGTFSQFAAGNVYGGEAIGVNESYAGAVGAYQMMEESSINAQAIFEHVLGCDFVEAQAAHGFVTESTLEAVNEASNSGIFGKVVEFFKKLGEKIKGIIQNVIDKIKAMCTKDGKELVKKFEKQINKKFNDGVYDDKFTYKWCKVLNSFESDAQNVGDKLFAVEMPSSISITDTAGPAKKNIETVLKGAKTWLEQSDSNVARDDEDANNLSVNDWNKKKNKSDADGRNTLTSDDISEYKDAVLTALLGENTDSGSFAKDYDEKRFDSEDTVEGLDHSRLNDAINTLKNFDKEERTLDKNKSQVDKRIKNIVKEAQDINKAMDKLSGKKGQFSGASAYARTFATNVISMGNALTSCTSMYYAAATTALKKEYKQARALYIKAATYNKKTAKNEAALLEAVVDVSNYEVDQMMPEC